MFGGGFSALGFTQAGFVQKCAVELQPKLADLHRSLHPSVPVLTADITDVTTAARIHEVCPEPATVMAGIACQPYSRAGKQEGGFDTRAATLPATLQIAHCLQAPALIMECVVPARDNQYVITWFQGGGLHDEVGGGVVSHEIPMVGCCNTPQVGQNHCATIPQGFNFGG